MDLQLCFRASMGSHTSRMFCATKGPDLKQTRCHSAGHVINRIQHRSVRSVPNAEARPLSGYHPAILPMQTGLWENISASKANFALPNKAAYLPTCETH